MSRGCSQLDKLHSIPCPEETKGCRACGGWSGRLPSWPNQKKSPPPPPPSSLPHLRRRLKSRERYRSQNSPHDGRRSRSHPRRIQAREIRAARRAGPRSVRWHHGQALPAGQASLPNDPANRAATRRARSRNPSATAEREGSEPRLKSKGPVRVFRHKPVHEKPSQGVNRLKAARCAPSGTDPPRGRHRDPR